MSAANDFSLPPNVSGRCRGNLDLLIENISWKTSKTFNDVKIHILWWGQKQGISCERIKIDINTKQIALKSLKEISYQIKTNNYLFQSYLENCEPVKIDIYSTKTSDFIGSSKIEIPQKFRNILPVGEEHSCTITSPILSSRQFCLGDLIVRLRIQIEETMTQKIPLKSVAKVDKKKEVKKSAVKSAVAPNVLNEKNFNKENIQVVGNKKKISFRVPKPDKPSTLVKIPPQKKPSKKEQVVKESEHSEPATTVTSSSSSAKTSPSKSSSKKSSLISYLSGMPMTRADERNILQDLVTISPSQSIMEDLDTAVVRITSKLKIADKIDSIRITISQVEFNAAGQLEMQNFMNQNRRQKFILKCAITSKIFKANEDIKMISPVFETAPQRITFQREINQRIIMLSAQSKSNIFVNFGFCLKSIEQQTSTFFVGFARVAFSEVISSKGSFHKKCPIINESDMRIGSLTVKLELGINGLHFGRDVIDSLYSRRENESIVSDDFSSHQKPIKLVNQKVQTKSHPSHSNDNCDAERNYDNKNVQTDGSSQVPQQANANSQTGPEDRDIEMVDVDKNKILLRSKVYRGLLFIEGLRSVKDQSTADYFITYEGFWNQCQETTEPSINFTFNYLKQFPLICDDQFLKRVQNNHLELKLWEKTDHSEKWIGSARVPLHQFYIAFRDTAMIEHLSANQLPIISIDAWSNFVSPLSSELFCQGKILLAIGNENQIEYLKLLRNLNNLQQPVRKKSAGVQVEEPVDPNSQIKNKLTAFIESLSQKLPEPSSMNCHKMSSSASSTSSGSTQLKKTSDLLESLQKALAQPRAPATLNHATDSAINQSHPAIDSDSSLSSMVQEKIRILISIEHASHLPKVVKKKQNRRKNKNSTTPQKVEFEPSAYATFESCLGQLEQSSLPDDIVKSHEGFVKCTKVLKGCDPQWNESFNVELPLDVLTNSQKRFIVKVWRKIAQDSDMVAAPFEDAVIGFSAVDLSVLLTGLPLLSGYYNIMDFSGRCNGQIKLSFKPLDNLLEYQDSSTSLPVVNSLMNPLNIEVGAADDGTNLLSRTLKRKFTELDEITQRLKARLFDVTGDENFDPDDEFEKDLNTAVDEMYDENFDQQEDFGWLKNDSNGNVFGEAANDFQSQFNKILEIQPSTSKQSVPESSSTIPTQRKVSGCSNTQPMPIDQLLKKYDLDTLINPNIFKNILDPTLANSDSTPTLNLRPIKSDDLVNISGDSGDTTVSSILSNDQVQGIQKALQKASLADGSDKSSSRKDPDGENNISE